MNLKFVYQWSNKLVKDFFASEDFKDAVQAVGTSDGYLVYIANVTGTIDGTITQTVLKNTLSTQAIPFSAPDQFDNVYLSLPTPVLVEKLYLLLPLTQNPGAYEFGPANIDPQGFVTQLYISSQSPNWTALSGIIEIRVYP